MYLDELASKLGMSLQYEKIEETVAIPMAQPFDATRAAYVRDQASGTILGIIGEYKSAVRRQFKLPVYTAGFEIDLLQLQAAVSTSSRYVIQSKYPKIEQDICLRVPAEVAYQQLVDFMAVTLEQLQDEDAVIRVSPLDIYQPLDQHGYKQITFRVTATHDNKTMQAAELSKLLEAAAQAARVAFDAEVI